MAGNADAAGRLNHGLHGFYGWMKTISDIHDEQNSCERWFIALRLLALLFAHDPTVHWKRDLARMEWLGSSGL